MGHKFGCKQVTFLISAWLHLSLQSKTSKHAKSLFVIAEYLYIQLLFQSVVWHILRMFEFEKIAFNPVIVIFLFAFNAFVLFFWYFLFEFPAVGGTFPLISLLFLTSSSFYLCIQELHRLPCPWPRCPGWFLLFELCWTQGKETERLISSLLLLCVWKNKSHVLTSCWSPSMQQQHICCPYLKWLWGGDLLSPFW